MTEGCKRFWGGNSRYSIYLRSSLASWTKGNGDVPHDMSAYRLGRVKTTQRVCTHSTSNI